MKLKCMLLKKGKRFRAVNCHQKKEEKRQGIFNIKLPIHDSLIIITTEGINLNKPNKISHHHLRHMIGYKENVATTTTTTTTTKKTW